MTTLRDMLLDFSFDVLTLEGDAGDREEMLDQLIEETITRIKERLIG